MASPAIPQCFDGASIIVMDNAGAFTSFQANECVALQDIVVDYDTDFDFRGLKEGLCS
jgi:hypothetical protein